MRKLTLTMALCLIASLSFAQKKVLNEVKSEIKGSKPNIEDARKMMQEVLSNPETENSAEAWYIAGMVESKQFDMEKAKEFIGQPTDDPIMFGAFDAILPYFEKAFELDQMPNEKGKVKPKFTKDMRSILKANRADFVGAGSYYFDQRDWKKAYNNLNLYLNLQDLPIMEGEKIQALPTDSSTLQIKYFSGVAAAHIPDHETAIAIFTSMKDQQYNESAVYQLLTEEYKAIGDSIAKIKILEEGVAKFPSEPFFILNLINENLNSGNIAGAIDYLNEAIANTPNDPLLYDVLGRVYEEDKQIDKAVESLNKALEVDPTYSDAYTHLGNVYYYLALRQIEDADAASDNTIFRQKMQEARESFEKSTPYYEKAMELNKEDRNAIINLRNVYYRLNKNEDYERLDAIYNSL